ncbi:MAG: DUF2510 domain-containing protein [Streptosporangiaceae bacterium]
MDMPPSGWYPDPYGVPGLLRWWDGSVWTEYTQSHDAPAGAKSTAVSPPPATAVRPAIGGPAPVTSFDLPPATSTDLPPATSTDIPPASGADQTSVDLPPASALDLPGGFHPPGESTRIFSSDDYTGYARVQDQRRVRRRWLMAALAAGTAVVLVVLVLALMQFGKQPSKPVALSTKSPVAHHTTAPASPTPATQLTDTSSGLAYTQFGSPWQAACPSGLDQQGFGWSAGESAVAGEVTINGQQTPWYGNACSGPLPAQYGYSSVADLSSVTSTLASTFENTFYNGLNHTVSQLADTPTSVSGHAAWEIKYLVTYTDASGQGLTWTSEEGAVVVADRGTGVEPAVFYVSMPSNLNENNVDSLVTSLSLSATTATTSPTASPSASASASATASPTPTATATATTGDGNGNGNGGGHGGGGGNGGGGGFGGFP